MKKRQPILLLEILIAFLIMTGVMALLFTGFYDAIKAKNSIKQEREKILTLQRLKLKFAVLFKKVIDVQQIPEVGYYIRHENEIDPKPSFRGEIESVLKLNNKVLTLISWPAEGEPRLEVLSENVTSMRFKFFDRREGKFNPEFPQQKPCMMKVFINDVELPLFL